MKNISTILSLILLAVVGFVNAQESKGSGSDAVIKYKVKTDVIYGHGKVVKDGKETLMDLWMDVYEPIETSNKPRPVVIFTHGGAFHRGNPRHTYHEMGANDTSPLDYCKKFAAESYVCFAISYRFAPDSPVPSYDGYSEEDLNLERLSMLMDQVNLIRRGMNLPVLDISIKQDEEIMKNAVLAAAEDLRTAITVVKDNSEKYNIDTNKIVLGGFSAGAITTMNVAYGMKEPVAGIFMLSGADIGFDIPKLLSVEDPPVLMFQGQYDLNSAIVEMPGLLTALKEKDINYSFNWVPAFGHFYPAGAVSLSSEGFRMSVEESIMLFLNETLKTQ